MRFPVRGFVNLKHAVIVDKGRKVNVYLPSLMMKVPNHLYVLDDTYMSHVNKVQPIRVKMICIAAIRVTCMKDLISGVKNTAESFLFLFTVSLPPHNPRSHTCLRKAYEG
jgi:hypothetical protein